MTGRLSRWPPSRTGTLRAVYGRSDELTTLLDLVGGLASGRGAALLIEGPPGIGKTTLLAAAAEHAGRLGVRTVFVTTSAHTRGAPWALAGDLVESLDRTLGGRLADLLRGPGTRALDLLAGRPTAISRSSYPIVHGVVCAVRDVALAEPLLICIDDAHLSDPESATVLAAMIARLGDAPFGLLIASRPPAPGSAGVLIDVDVSSSAYGAHRLWLEDLDEAAIRSIVAERLSDTPSELRERVVRAVGGNPLLAYESAELCARSTAGEFAPDAIADALDPYSGIIRRSTLARLGAGGANAGQVAAAISVLGPDARVDRVAALTDLDREETLHVIEQLRRNDLVVVAENRLAIRHPLVEEMIRAEVGELGRVALHAAAADALHLEAADDEAVVEHLLAGRGATAGAPWMVTTLRRAAARQLGLGSPSRAVELLDAALPLCDDQSDRTAVKLDQAHALAATGSDEVDAKLDAIVDDLAAQRSTPPHDLNALAEIAETQYATGQFAVAERTCDRALGMLGLASSTVRETFEWAEAVEPDATMLVARLLVGRDSAALLGGHASRLDQSVDDLIAERRRAPSPAVRLLAAMRAGERALGVDIAADHLRLLIETADVGDALPDALVRPVYEPIGTALAMAGHAAEAVALLTRLLDRATEQGELAAHVSLLPVRAFAMLRLGRLADAVADAEGALRLAQEAPTASRYGSAPAIYVAVCAEIERAHLDEARRLVTVDDAEKRWGDSQVYGWFLCAVGRAALADRDAATAERAFAQAGAIFSAPGGHGAVVPWRTGLALARQSSGDLESAHNLVREQRAAADAVGDVRLLAESHRVGAGLVADHQQAADQLAEAVELISAVDDPLTLAHVEIDRGLRLRRAGELRSARSVLATAFDRAHRIGAHRLAAVASEELERAGARRKSVAASGVDSLTPAELRVARLAATGRRNRDIADALFVSIKTVESQLSAVYRKLDVPGRDDLSSIVGA